MRIDSYVSEFKSKSTQRTLIVIVHEEGGHWALLRYERGPSMCYRCGRIGLRSFDMICMEAKTKTVTL